MGEARTPHFYDSRIFEPVTKAQNQQFSSLETHKHTKSLFFYRIIGPIRHRFRPQYNIDMTICVENTTKPIVGSLFYQDKTRKHCVDISSC